MNKQRLQKLAGIITEVKLDNQVNKLYECFVTAFDNDNSPEAMEWLMKSEDYWDVYLIEGYKVLNNGVSYYDDEEIDGDKLRYLSSYFLTFLNKFFGFNIQGKINHWEDIYNLLYVDESEYFEPFDYEEWGDGSDTKNALGNKFKYMTETGSEDLLAYYEAIAEKLGVESEFYDVNEYAATVGHYFIELTVFIY